MSIVEEEEKKPDSAATYVNLIVVAQDKSEVRFRIRRNLPLKKLLNVYCERQSIDFSSVVFLIDGHHFRKEMTPDELEMKDGDEIDVMVKPTEQLRSKEMAGSMESGDVKGHKKAAAAGNNHINLKVIGQDRSEVCFRIKGKVPLMSLMNAYCERQSLDFYTVRFLYDGSRIGVTKTPDELEMQDGDVIDAMLDQISGGGGTAA